MVVSPDQGDQRGGSPDRLSGGMDQGGLGGGATPPRAGTFNRLRTGPKDTIPMVGKPPRKQRSSRFVVTEKVEIERLPPFLGAQHLLSHSGRFVFQGLTRSLH